MIFSLFLEVTFQRKLSILGLGRRLVGAVVCELSERSGSQVEAEPLPVEVLSTAGRPALQIVLGRSRPLSIQIGRPPLQTDRAPDQVWVGLDHAPIQTDAPPV